MIIHLGWLTAVVMASLTAYNGYNGGVNLRLRLANISGIKATFLCVNGVKH